MKINDSDDLIVQIFKTGLLKLWREKRAIEIPVNTPIVKCQHPQEITCESFPGKSPGLPIAMAQSVTVPIRMVKVACDQFGLGICPACGRLYFFNVSWHALNREKTETAKIQKAINKKVPR